MSNYDDLNSGSGLIINYILLFIIVIGIHTLFKLISKQYSQSENKTFLNYLLD